MTPEERAQQLDRWIVSHYGVSKGRYTAYSEILDCIRAALRERDARLLRLAAEWDEHAESVWNEEPHTAADFTRCAKDLRALLEEAGSNG